MAAAMMQGPARKWCCAGSSGRRLRPLHRGLPSRADGAPTVPIYFEFTNGTRTKAVIVQRLNQLWAEGAPMLPTYVLARGEAVV